MLGFQETLEVVGFDDLPRYSGQSLAYCFLFMQAFGTYRNSHLNSQDKASLGVIMGAARRPDQDTTSTYLKRLAEHVDPRGFMVEACRRDTYSWLHRDPGGVWYIDGHVVESFTAASIVKKRHGTKHTSVKAVEKYSLRSGPVELSLYRDETSMVEVIKRLVELGDRTFPEAVEVVAFDKGGSCYELFDWFDDQEKVFITWLENNAPNRKVLEAIADEEFIDWEGKVGKGEEEAAIVAVADVEQLLKGKLRRLIVCQRPEGRRFALVTNAKWTGPLCDRRVLSAWKLLEVMRYKQRVENSFKLSIHEMGGNVIPDRCIEVETERQPYELEKEKKKLERAHKKLCGLEQKQQEKQALWERGDLSKKEYNVLCKDITRQRKNLQAKIDKLEVETAGVEVDEAGRSVVAVEKSRLNTTRMGLLEVFKKYAIQAMAIVASLMGLAGMGPEKLRRVFLERGGVVVVDEAALVMRVIANPFPSQATQRAYERLCWELNTRETTFKREGKEYTLTFTWLEKGERAPPNHLI
jgi:hypothetical protein